MQAAANAPASNVLPAPATESQPPRSPPPATLTSLPSPSFETTDLALPSPVLHRHPNAQNCHPAVPRPVAHGVSVAGIDVKLEDVARLAPVVLLHPEETYLPCSVETLLAGAKLMNANGELVIANPIQDDLLDHCNDGCRVTFDPVHYTGDPLDEDNAVRAPMYVSAQSGPNGAYIDLQYIFLFAYNGAQTARVRVPAASFNCTLPNFAEHEGDIEGVHIRVTPDCKSIIRMGVAGHGHPTYFTPSEITFENTHPIVRCAYNSHATYNHTGRAEEEYIVTDSYTGVGFGVEFVDLTASNGPRWQPFDVDTQGRTTPNDQLLFVGLDRKDRPLGNQPWATFRGQLGAHWTNGFHGAQGIGKRKLSCMQTTYTNTIAKAAVAAGATKDRSNSNGTAGLGVRTFIHEDAVEDGDAKY